MKEHHGPLAPALPPPKGEPDPFPVKVRVMLNQLVDQVRSTHKDRYRCRRIVLFKERKLQAVGSNGRDARPMSEIRAMDRPEIELILNYRDRVLGIDNSLARIHAKLDRMTANTPDEFADLAKISTALVALEDKRLRYTTAIESILKTLGQESLTREQMMTKLASDAAKLAQGASQHQDKMEIARAAVSDPSTEDLMKKVAEKHGVSVEQMQSILNAKSVDSPIDDT